MAEKAHSYLALAPGWRTHLIPHVSHDTLQAFLGVFRMVCSSIIEIDNLCPLLKDIFRRKLLVYGEAMATRSLPPCSSNPAASNFKEATSRWRWHLITAEQNNQRRYVVWLESLNHLLGHDCSGHGSTGVGCDCVNINIVFRTFTGKRTGETKDTTFLGEC